MQRYRLAVVPVLALAVALPLVIHGVSAQDRSSPPAPVGAVAAHLAGRLVVDASGVCEMIGYYPFIDGLGPLFAGAPSEQTAMMSFRSGQFILTPLANGVLTHLRSQPLAGTSVHIRLYFNPSPNRDFANPQSFSDGQLVATFRTRGSMATALAPLLSTSMGSLELESSSPFEVNGRRVNFRDLGDGVTISLTSVAPDVSSYLGMSFPFGGTAVVAERRLGRP